jgi:hypothetical protein
MRNGKTHLRIHLTNGITWCGRQIIDSPTSTLSVVTHPTRLYDLTRVRYSADGEIDYTPLTDSEREEIKTLREASNARVTCQRCRKALHMDSGF